MLVPQLDSVGVHETAWSPTSISVPLQMELDACFVPTHATGELRVDVSNVVVIDGLIDDQLRIALLEVLSDNEFSDAPPREMWEQRTVDDVSNPEPTWGLKDDQLLALKHKWPVVELHSRLQLVYPGVQFSHMPAESMQAKVCPDEAQRQAPVHGVCQQFVANAAVSGNQFRWHVDADPANIPPDSDWAGSVGLYANREPGRPRFVSLLAYLNSQWGLDEHAETLFLDTATDTGAFVRPRPGRVVLMDQDVLHRASAPAAAARRPRYSLVWKLLASATPPLPTPTAVQPASAAPPVDVRGASPPVATAPNAEDEEPPSRDERATAGGRSGDRVDGCRRGPGAASTCEHEVVAEVEAVRPAAQRAAQRTVSILLPEHGGVTAFGSARRMRDLQDRVAGAAGAQANSSKKPRRL